MSGAPRTPRTPSRVRVEAESASQKGERLLRWCSLSGASAAVAATLSACAEGQALADGEGTPRPVQNQILLDVPRSCHFDVCQRWGSKERSAHLHALSRVLDAVFPLHKQHQFPFYVQGAHDVASVLLLAVGEAGAITILSRLVAGPLRGFLQPTMLVPTAMLSAVHTLIKWEDPLLACHIEKLIGAHCIWALPWLLTWLSHSVESLPAAITLFDGCLGRHPARPVYIAAFLVLSARFYLLEEVEEGALMIALQVLPRQLQTSDALALLAGADGLQAVHPPLELLCCMQPSAQATLAHDWPELWESGDGTAPVPTSGARGSLFARLLSTCAHLRGAALYRWVVLKGIVSPPPGSSKLAFLLPWQLIGSLAALLLSVVLGRVLVQDGGDKGQGRNVEDVKGMLALGLMAALRAGLHFAMRLVGFKGWESQEWVTPPR